MIVSVGELQKNISLLNNIKEPIIVIDKRSNTKIAKIEPLKNNDLDLLEKLINNDIKITPTNESFEKVYTNHLKSKYGIS